MGRPNKPWFRESSGTWVVKVGGRMTTLARGRAAKKDAHRAFHALMAAGKKAAVAGISLRALKDVFLDAAERDLKPLTYEFYRRHCLGFWKHTGDIAAADIRPLHVTAWLNAHAWGPTTRHGAITAIKRMYRWGRKEGHLEADPLADMEKPSPRRREEIMSPDQVDVLFGAIRDREFRDLLRFVRDTGCRPSEAMIIEARHIDLGSRIITLRSKTSDTTGERVIHLTAAMTDLCRQLATKWPDGPILRNTDGNPWNRFATKNRFARLRAKLGFGKEATVESLRHEFITDGLEAGVPIKTMAELAGHASTAMIDRHYSHIANRRGHLKEAVDRVRPDRGDPVTRDGTACRPADDPDSGPGP